MATGCKWLFEKQHDEEVARLARGVPVEAFREPAGQLGAFAVGSVSLPVSSAEVLRWLEKRASYYDSEAAKYLCEILAGRAEECRTLAKGLRRQMDYTDMGEP